MLYPTSLVDKNCRGIKCECQHSVSRSGWIGLSNRVEPLSLSYHSTSFCIFGFFLFFFSLQLPRMRLVESCKNSHFLRIVYIYFFRFTVIGYAAMLSQTEIFHKLIFVWSKCCGQKWCQYLIFIRVNIFYNKKKKKEKEKPLAETLSFVIPWESLC